ncbi:MAG: phosphopentomutase [Ruminococcaceae bacterium]|nr:phosphopentomutase [Oscillospiraceae bacterium]
MKTKRVFLIILDSFGIGAMPDAADYGDSGANTLASLRSLKDFDLPTLKSLGLYNIKGVGGGVDDPKAAYCRLAEKSKGKDTIVGHWEICGVVSERPMPTYPQGFPDEVIQAFTALTGKNVICNKPYSGTEVIKDYGEEHIKTGDLIVYTSADSVFQIAAHEDVIPVEELYEYCAVARKMLKGKHGVGRVIARPFTGAAGNFQRTPRRKDYALAPPCDTTLNRISDKGLSVIAVGKINDIFAGSGITAAYKTKSNKEGMELTSRIQSEDFEGLCFVNLVDFDMIYGHRRDVSGYAAAAREFDAWLEGFIKGMRPDDVLMISGDHGCDPGYGHTDHTREYTPLLIYGSHIKPLDLGEGASFALIGKAAEELLGVSVAEGDGTVDKILK